MAERRLKLIVSYDGRDFAGWQSQKHGNTIQDRIEKAVAKIVGKRCPVAGAGRTDAGVHALGQCAHVDVPAGKLTTERWVHAVNANLPLTIRVLRAQFVPEKFHARFSAKQKMYRYRIINAPVFSPLEIDRAWHIAADLDRAELKRAAKLFIGGHDFRGFAASRGKVELDTTRTMKSVRIYCARELIELEFVADGFLYRMVRLMVGAIVSCGSGRVSLQEIDNRLANPGAAGAHVVAPAGGLYLVHVQY